MIESYYLETQEGLFFAVKGVEHPADRIIAVVRYAPDEEKGNRRKGKQSYRRLYHFAEQEQLLKANYPQYLAYDPVFQTTLQSVPKTCILSAYDPRLRLQELMQKRRGEGIEEDAVAFACLLRAEAGVPSSAIGVTGSLLIGLHTESSDLDMAIFGRHECHRVYHALQRLLDVSQNAELRRLDSRGIEALFTQRTADTRMAFDEFIRLEKRKVNQGSFRNREYFIRFMKEAHEPSGIYSRQKYTPLGRVVIAARIADDQETIFTPCRYLLSDVRTLEGEAMPGPDEIVSFRGRFCEQAIAGEHIMAAGTLERVDSIHGDVRNRLLLGNSPDDTMVLWGG